MKNLDMFNVLPAIGKLNEPVLFFFTETMDCYEKATKASSLVPGIIAYLIAVKSFHERLIALRQVIEADIADDIQQFNDEAVTLSRQEGGSPAPYIKTANLAEASFNLSVRNVLKGQIDRTEALILRGEKVKEKFYITKKQS